MENKNFSEEELRKLADIARPGYILTESEAEHGYIGGAFGYPPTYNLYKKYMKDVAEGKLRRPPCMIDDYDRFYKIFDHTEEEVEKALEIIGQYAYVFPQNPNEPVEVKINVHAMSDFDIKEFERKLLEVLNNDNKKSD